jgi:UDP-N-acetyl-D-glucosamine dehydrogenase
LFAIAGFDIDTRKMDTLNAGGSYVVRIEAKEIQAARANGFTPTTDLSRISEMDAVIICVPTPLDEFRQPDMSYITGTAENIASP